MKAIGNIGYFGKDFVLSSYAINEENSLEVRISALQALRRFSCEQLESKDYVYTLFQDQEENVEIRINSFNIIMKCSDSSERFEKFLQNELNDFLLNEEDIQVNLIINDFLL
jgi:hypothetical protein